MQPHLSGAGPYYPPTSGTPASPPSGYPSYPADAPPSGGYGSGAYGSGAYGAGTDGAPSAGSYGSPRPTFFTAPPSTTFGAPPPGSGSPPGPPPGSSVTSKKTVIPLILGIVVALIAVGVGCFGSGYMYGMQRAEASVAEAQHLAASPGTGPSGAAPSATVPSVGIDGTWTGTYTCGQGETGLRLTFQGPDDKLTATFEFFAIGSNPNVRSGSYKMGGSIVGGSLRLIGTEWIDQPDGYRMVNLSSSSITATRITGTVEADGCTEFSLTRG